MENTSNLRIDDETTETRQKVYYVSRINPKLPWPTNSTLAIFVSGGKYKKYRVLSVGDDNIKVVVVK